MFVLSWADWILAAEDLLHRCEKIFHVLENAAYGPLESQQEVTRQKLLIKSSNINFVMVTLRVRLDDHVPARVLCPSAGSG